MAEAVEVEAALVGTMEMTVKVAQQAVAEANKVKKVVGVTQVGMSVI